MNSITARFEALVVKEILDDKGSVVVRAAEKRANVEHEVRNLVGPSDSVDGAVAAVRTPHLRIAVYPATAFADWDAIPPVEIAEKAPA